MAESPPFWLIGATLAAYFAFFVAFGTQVFDASYADGFSFTDLDNAARDLVALITFGGGDSPLPGGAQVALLLAIGVPWLFQVARLLQIVIPG